ncbi:MAG: SpoIID/LytB domain-containing protein, partial [Phycisphaerales bacterium]|nr:SpoIID/LytB domain-containing protein [Phycisphaerales bacterium]
PDIRVRLREAATTARVGISQGDTIWAMAIGAGRPPATLRTPVTIALDDTGWLLTDTAGVIARFPRLNDLELAPQRDMLSGVTGEMGIGGVSSTDRVTRVTAGRLARDASTVNLTAKMTLDNVRFPGKFVLSPRSDVTARTFDLIEHAGIEEYLVGVVAAEMWPNWPRQAFGAQAVAARSYAIQQRNLSRLAGSKFDVESSVRDQAYKGAADNPNAALAVRDTEGVVLLWNGQVLRAYYSSTAGPNPASARDTWPIVRGFEYNLVGPLQAGEREAGLGRTSPFYRWQVTRTSAEMQQRLRAWGQINGGTLRTLAEIVSVRPAATNATGRPTRFVITDRNGTQHTLSAEQLRQASNTDAPGLAKIVRENRVNSSDMDAWTINGPSVTIAGRGFGHGVGMCQYSAKELADRGVKWPEIVGQFYPGAELKRVY